MYLQHGCIIQQMQKHQIKAWLPYTVITIITMITEIGVNHLRNNLSNDIKTIISTFLAIITVAIMITKIKMFCLSSHDHYKQ